MGGRVGVSVVIFVGCNVGIMVEGVSVNGMVGVGALLIDGVALGTMLGHVLGN